MITLSSINKSYGKKKEVKAVTDFSLQVGQGELFGLIGPDGAGKTSLFRILTTLLLPDSGSASVNGWDVVNDYKRIRHSVGYMPGRFSLYQDLTVEENLNFFATIFQTSIQENYELIRDIYVQIEPFKHRRAGQLSGGMKQKLALCCALIHRPKVLFLDEPTTGVDAVSRKEFWAMLRNLKSQGITMLVSTPYMDEAALCDRVALIQQGRRMALDTPKGVVEKFGRPIWAVKANSMLPLLRAVEELPGVENAYPSGVYHHVVFQPGAEVTAIVKKLSSDRFPGLEWKETVPEIEDCFMLLMKQH